MKPHPSVNFIPGQGLTDGARALTIFFNLDHKLGCEWHRHGVEVEETGRAERDLDDVTETQENLDSREQSLA